MSKILIVEDDSSFSDLVTRYLERNGHVVVEVSNAEAALAAMLGDEFDVVLTDFDLGNFSETGLKVIEDASSLMPFHCRTILWSGILRDEEVKHAAVQPNYNLVKSDIDDVLKIIEEEE